MRKGVWLFAGGIIGFGITIPVVGYYQELLLDLAKHIWVTAVYGAIGILILFPVGYYFVKRWIERRFGVKSLHVDSLSSRINEAVWEVASSNKHKARIKTKQLVSDVISFISHSLYYRWMFTAFISILVALGGTLGTIVLLKQNDKISEQTAAIKEQNQLYILEYIKLKSDELKRVVNDARDIRRSLLDDEIGEIAKLYNYGKESSCFPLPKTDQTHIIVSPADNANTAVVSNDWRINIELLSGSVRAALEGAATDAPHHRAFRARLLSSLAMTGLPFSIFSFNSFESSELNSVNMAGANLDKAILSRSRLDSVDFTDVCAVAPMFDFIKARRVMFDKTVLIDPVFYGSEVSNSSFKGARIKGSLYSIKSTSYAVGVHVVPMDDNDNDKAMIEKAVVNVLRLLRVSDGAVEGASEVAYRVGSGADFSNAAFYRVNFSNTSLDGVDFSNSKLLNSTFYNATLDSSVCFDGVDMTNTDFRLSSASNKQLDTISFRGANFRGAIIDGLDFGNNKTVTVEQLSRGCTCSNKYPRLNNEDVKVKLCIDFMFDGGVPFETIMRCNKK